jgi:hypothetical protein
MLDGMRKVSGAPRSQMAKLNRLTQFAAAGMLALGAYMAYQRLENDWPRIYAFALEHCSAGLACSADLSMIYGGTWTRAVAFEAGGEQQAKERVVGASLPDFDESRQGLVLLGADGAVQSERYSGKPRELTQLQLSELVRLEFAPKSASWSVSREQPWVCIHREARGREGYIGVTVGRCA